MTRMTKHKKSISMSPKRSPQKSSQKSPRRLSGYQEFVKKYAKEHRGKHTGPHAGRELISAAAKAWKLEGGGRISDFTNYLGLKGDYAKGVKSAIKNAKGVSETVGQGLYHGAVAVGHVTNSAGYIANDLARAFA